MTHEVSVLCSCPDINQCRTELYIADVRVAEQHAVLLADALMAIMDTMHKQADRLRMTVVTNGAL